MSIARQKCRGLLDGPLTMHESSRLLLVAHTLITPRPRMASLDIELVPLLKDNYAYLLHDSATGTTAVVDPSEARPVLAVARARGWRITHVLSTPHHWDHPGGNLEITQAPHSMVIAPAYDQRPPPACDA